MTERDSATGIRCASGKALAFQQPLAAQSRSVIQRELPNIFDM
jgi:hypothetical protein